MLSHTVSLQGCLVFSPAPALPLGFSSQGQRLRASGRLQEADEVDDMAAAIETRAEDHWRKRVEVSRCIIWSRMVSVAYSSVSHRISRGALALPSMQSRVVAVKLPRIPPAIWVLNARISR